jgi:hypothetical protein
MGAQHEAKCQRGVGEAKTHGTASPGPNVPPPTRCYVHQHDRLACRLDGGLKFERVNVWMTMSQISLYVVLFYRIFLAVLYTHSFTTLMCDVARDLRHSVITTN